MTVFYNMGVDALSWKEVMGVRERLEEEREGEVVGEDGVAVHVVVYGERGVRNVGVGEGSDERVVNENMGFWNEVGEEKQSRVEKVVRLACGDKVVSNGGV